MCLSSGIILYIDISRGDLQHVIHMTIVVIQQVKLQSSGVCFAVVNCQTVEVSGAIHPKGTQLAVVFALVKKPELNVLVLFLGYKAGGGQSAAIFFPEHRAGEKAAIEFV